MDEARDLFDEGNEAFISANYQHAIQCWIEAYALIPSEWAYRQLKADLIYNIAKAEQQSFKIDRDIDHLRRAKVLLESHRNALRDSSGEETDPDLAKLAQELADLDAQIQAAELERIHDPEVRSPVPKEVSPRSRKPRSPTRRPQVAAGFGVGLMAVGFVGLGVSISGLILRVDEQPEVFIVSSAASLAAVSGGAALLSISHLKIKYGSRARTVQISPPILTVSAAALGTTFTIRF